MPTKIGDFILNKATTDDGEIFYAVSYVFDNYGNATPGGVLYDWFASKEEAINFIKSSMSEMGISFSLDSNGVPQPFVQGRGENNA